MTQEEKDKIFKDGENANDNNRRYYRTRKGNIINCPYTKDSEEYKIWREGYNYRDMVNDG